MNKVVHFDKEIVALTSLEILLHCLKSVKNQDSYWQWIFISLHNAVQCFMVLTLTGSNSLNTYTEKDAKRLLESYKKGEPSPTVRLDYYLSLYERTKTELMLIYANSKLFSPQGTQDDNIQRLNDLRNQFVHFQYDFSSIILDDTPFQIVIDCLDYIEFLAFESNNIVWFNIENANNSRLLIDRCKAEII